MILNIKEEVRVLNMGILRHAELLEIYPLIMGAQLWWMSHCSMTSCQLLTLCDKFPRGYKGTLKNAMQSCNIPHDWMGIPGC